MTVLHSGSTKKFSSNWENIFSSGKKPATKKAETTKKLAAKKKSAKSKKKK